MATQTKRYTKELPGHDSFPGFVDTGFKLVPLGMTFIIIWHQLLTYIDTDIVKLPNRCR